MSAVIDRAWEEYNKAYLNGMLERLRSLIQDSGRDTARHAHFPPPRNNARPPAIESLGDIFALSSFERDLLLLTAAPELNADFKRLLAKKSGDDNADFASLGLALAILVFGCLLLLLLLRLVERPLHGLRPFPPQHVKGRYSRLPPGRCRSPETPLAPGRRTACRGHR